MFDRDSLVHALAAMTDDEFARTVRDARGASDAAQTPQERASAALRRHRGLDRPTSVTPEQAADALRRYTASGGD